MPAEINANGQHTVSR